MGNGLYCAGVLIMKRDDIIFVITKEDLQNEAMERIGRELTEEEVGIATDAFECGFRTMAVDVTYQTIFRDMIKNE